MQVFPTFESPRTRTLYVAAKSSAILDGPICVYIWTCIYIRTHTPSMEVESRIAYMCQTWIDCWKAIAQTQPPVTLAKTSSQPAWRHYPTPQNVSAWPEHTRFLYSNHILVTVTTDLIKIRCSRCFQTESCRKMTTNAARMILQGRLQCSILLEAVTQHPKAMLQTFMRFGELPVFPL